MAKILKIRNSAKSIKLHYDLLRSPHLKLNSMYLEKITNEIMHFVNSNWGNFGRDFIENHVLKSDQILLLRDADNKLIGLASISEKEIDLKKIYYFELTVVDKEYESLNIALMMNTTLIKRLVIRNFINLRFTLDFMLITPNMRVLGALAGISSTIYPDPYKYDILRKKLPLADRQTWIMAKSLIKQSEKPQRKIHREGLVLEGSYDETPWLIYEPGQIPKYKHELLNEFGEHYLGYSKKEGKEFIVRAQFDLCAIIRGIFK